MDRKRDAEREQKIKSFSSSEVMFQKYICYTQFGGGGAYNISSGTEEHRISALRTAF